MRVLMISDFYPPVIGGSERSVQTLSRLLVGRGHEVSVATLAQPGSPAFEIDDGVRVHRIDGWSRALLPLYQDPTYRFHPPMPDPGIARRLLQLVDEIDPDIVHGHGWMLYSYLAVANRRRPGVVLTLHDYSFACAKKTLVRDGAMCPGPALGRCVRCAGEHYGHGKGEPVVIALRASRSLNRRVDEFTAISTSVADASAVAIGARDRIVVIPSFVPDAIATEGLAVERPAYLPPDDDYVLFVGALGAHKGVDVLLEADRILGHRIPIVLIGTPQPGGPVVSAPSVTVVHNVAHESVMAAWRHCEIAAVPSVWAEPFGQVAVEAMTCGKPVVASKTGGLADIVVDGESGLFVPPGDARALATAIERLHGDPGLRERLGAAAVARAKRFTVSAVVGQVEELYAGVVARRTADAARSVSG